MKVYLINLDRSPERLSFMDQQFSSIGVEYERISAVDGRALDADDYLTSPLNLNEIACTLSHQAVWRRLLSSSECCCAVFEDDAVLSASLPIVLASDRWRSDDYDVVKLETYGLPRRLTYGYAKVAGHRLHGLASTHHGTAGYILHRSAAQRLLEMTSAHLDEVDVIMFGRIVQSGAMRIMQIVPALVRQRSTDPQETEAAFQSLIDVNNERANAMQQAGMPARSGHGRRARKLLLKPVERALRAIRFQFNKNLTVTIPVPFH